jgi:hypothetical protein
MKYIKISAIVFSLLSLLVATKMSYATPIQNEEYEIHNLLGQDVRQEKCYIGNDPWVPRYNVDELLVKELHNEFHHRHHPLPRPTDCPVVPTPAPPALLLLGVGVACLVGIRKRFRSM